MLSSLLLLCGCIVVSMLCLRVVLVLVLAFVGVGVGFCFMLTCQDSIAFMIEFPKRVLSLVLRFAEVDALFLICGGCFCCFCCCFRLFWRLCSCDLCFFRCLYCLFLLLCFERRDFNQLFGHQVPLRCDGSRTAATGSSDRLTPLGVMQISGSEHLNHIMSYYIIQQQQHNNAIHSLLCYLVWIVLLVLVDVFVSVHPLNVRLL